VLNPEKIWHENLDLFTQLSDVATLPWEIKKAFFNIIMHIVQIIYATSEENK